MVHVPRGFFSQNYARVVLFTITSLIYQNMRLNEKFFTQPERQSVVVSERVEGLEVNHSVVRFVAWLHGTVHLVDCKSSKNQP